MKTVEFCSHCSKCPVIKVADNGTVEIGEEGNSCKLEADQFGDLKKAILNGDV